MYRSFGKGINKFRSGLIEVSDRNIYSRNLYRNNQEYAERHRQKMRDKLANDPEYAEQRRKHYRDRYANDPEWAEHLRQYQRNKLATPEGKIYQRVRDFNRRHPDLATETPMEAKLKYLESGYIPRYIKRDDIDGAAV